MYKSIVIDTFKKIFKKSNTFIEKPLNKEIETPKDIIESIRKDIYKITIDHNHKVTFKSLKKELEEQYQKLGFSEIAYDRENSFLLKNPDEIESYVSLRYDTGKYIIQVNKAEKPLLKVLEQPTKK